MPAPLPSSFYMPSATTVARALLGARLVRVLPDGARLSGRIVETEAYTGLDDLASHGRVKPTPRNRPMYGPPGRAYVYFTYGNYWMFNVVCEPEGDPAAVLVRAIEPLEGLDEMAARRPDRAPFEWTSGPGKLVLALGISGADNTLDLTTTANNLWIEPDAAVPDDQVRTGPRIGMGQTPEPWHSIPWRWWVAGNPFVSHGSGRKG
ncbi:putative 3-methyladenine DNA glycosylase [Candidatus Promineifilum breve]|uniref:Putative 3-methyladenine DNA glycosylase n=1 Tax=Candidatus Promineifilum breve TaxID=1806508 RepID=A0A160T1Z6_9CHLR|nr:DNA-3-methyladenine glycosylase [Candidatus Promineifilum breve]CUS03644.2 putative 3-methyladenine DNA glycosylase [Candidatus Promineifilum breve]